LEDQFLTSFLLERMSSLNRFYGGTLLSNFAQSFLLPFAISLSLSRDVSSCPLASQTQTALPYYYYYSPTRDMQSVREPSHVHPMPFIQWLPRCETEVMRPPTTPSEEEEGVVDDPKITPPTRLLLLQRSHNPILRSSLTTPSGCTLLEKTNAFNLQRRPAASRE